MAQVIHRLKLASEHPVQLPGYREQLCMKLRRRKSRDDVAGVTSGVRTLEIEACGGT